MAIHVASFMGSHLGMLEPTDVEVGCVTMLVYSSKGTTQKKKDLESFPALELIGMDNMKIFKIIFDKPKKDLLTKFF